MNPSICEIVKKYLEDNKYDGLCGDGCGCFLDDLMPCDGDCISGCRAGYKVKLTKENIEYYYPASESSEIGDYIMVIDKGKEIKGIDGRGVI